jgi:hypothetical protein
VAYAFGGERASKGSMGEKSVGGKLFACVEDLDSDFMCTRRFDLNIFDLERLARTPAYGGLALDDLSGSFGHGNPDTTRTTLSMVNL